MKVSWIWFGSNLTCTVQGIVLRLTTRLKKSITWWSNHKIWKHLIKCVSGLYMQYILPWFLSNCCIYVFSFATRRLTLITIKLMEIRIWLLYSWSYWSLTSNVWTRDPCLTTSSGELCFGFLMMFQRGGCYWRVL